MKFTLHYINRREGAIRKDIGSNGKAMEDPDDGWYKYLDILERVNVFHREIKDTSITVYFKRLKHILKSKLSSGRFLAAFEI